MLIVKKRIKKRLEGKSPIVFGPLSHKQSLASGKTKIACALASVRGKSMIIVISESFTPLFHHHTGTRLAGGMIVVYQELPARLLMNNRKRASCLLERKLETA